MINVQNVPSALFILYLKLKESKALHRTNQYTRVMVYAFGVHTGKALFWFFPPDLGDPYMPPWKEHGFPRYLRKFTKHGKLLDADGLGLMDPATAPAPAPAPAHAP